MIYTLAIKIRSQIIRLSSVRCRFLICLFLNRNKMEALNVRKRFEWIQPPELYVYSSNPLEVISSTSRIL